MLTTRGPQLHMSGCSVASWWCMVAPIATGNPKELTTWANEFAAMSCIAVLGFESANITSKSLWTPDSLRMHSSAQCSLVHKGMSHTRGDAPGMHISLATLT